MSLCNTCSPHTVVNKTTFDLQDYDAPRLKIQPAIFVQQLLHPFVPQTAQKMVKSNDRS